jgi:PKD repeat protein
MLRVVKTMLTAPALEGDAMRRDRGSAASVGALLRRAVGLLRGAIQNMALALVALAATVSAASADTLLMPKRDFLMGASEVVWGVTTQANGTAFTLDYGDGSALQAGNVVDRSYIAFNHTYALPGTYTVTLTVGAEVATTTVRVFNGAVLTAADLRGLNINRAIEDGLRWLWTAQASRAANFPGGLTTNWGRLAYTSLVVLAYENHGYKVPNNNSAPVGVYERFAVQRGLNHIVANQSLVTLGVQPAGDPCVGGVEPAPCQGLFTNDVGGYSTAISSLALSGSSAFNRTIPAGLGGTSGAYVGGRTIGEVLQRLMNTVAWGQNDGVGCAGRGGWIYNLSNNVCQNSDGSTVGWGVLSLLDAAAGGVAEPAFAKPEFGFAMNAGTNDIGSLDYTANNNPASASFPNVARAGIMLQALFYMGVPVGDARVTNAVNYINSRWSGVAQGGDYTGTCGSTKMNKGCAYAMYNVFKGLRLYGINSLPAAADWYAEYQDWLVDNQTSPTALTGGSWTGGAGKTAISFSCCDDSSSGNAAIAELILAPVALIAPDPGLFATVGLSPATAVNPVGTNHTVTAFAQSSTGAPIPGVTVRFEVLSGPNAGKTGSGVTGADGKTPFTYQDTNGAGGVDRIQAFIGTLGSNVVTKTWVVGICDADRDGDVDRIDLSLISRARGQRATGADDPRDSDGDGQITPNDVKVCTAKCTRPNCATQ